ncbi:MAG: NHLP family bacteriocin export ABC transporter peptidase/permease/ATPase subunit [Isosphaeraceae bacterium]
MAKQWSRRYRRVKTPTVLQMEATECGAAALGIILGYHGRFVPLEELRVECRVSRDGSNALYIKKTAEKYGLKGRGFQRSLEQLREIEPPFMVFWELNPFLVVEGFARGRVYLSDPATGRRSVDEETFVRSYTGIVFEFEVTPEFRKGGVRPNTWRSISRRIQGARPAVLFVVLAGLVVMLCELIAAAYHLVFVDQLLIEERSQWIRPLLLAMGLTVFFRLVAGATQLAALRRLKLSLAIVHSARFLWHVLRLPISFYHQRYAGDVSGRVDSNSLVAELISGQLATTIVGMMLVVFYAAVMIRFDPFLAGIGLLLGSLNLAAISFSSQFLSDENLKIKQIRGRLYGCMMRAIQTIETIKSSALESETLVRLTGYQARVTNSYQVVGIASALLVSLPPLLMLFTTAAVLWVGGTHVIQGLLSIGALIALQTLMASFNRPFADLVRLGSSVQSLEAELSRLDDVQQFPLDVTFKEPDAPPGQPVVATPIPPRRLSGLLELRNVTFGYNQTIDEPTIRRFSLEIQPGSRVAIVGTSGSGKSTIGKLVAGLYRPWEGEILYDGFRIDQIPRDVFTDQVALVDDQTFLFAGSIRENLTLWDDTVAERDTTRAAIDAAIHRDIIRRRGGYHSTLSEGARNLSGGQRQRLEVARALVRNPAILVLDEATNALDPITESLVDDHLRRRGCTCLIIAHRLSTIRDCDEILVLHQGRVVQRGTHDELMADAEGYYYELQTIQSALDAPLAPSSELPTSLPGDVRTPPRLSLADQAVRGDGPLKLLDASSAASPNGLASEAFPLETTAEPERHSDPLPPLHEVPALLTALEPYRETVTTAGNHPLPLDDVGAVWKVIDGEVDVFYVEPAEAGQIRGRRRHLCRVEEGGSIFAIDGVRSEEQGGLLAVGVGLARLTKFPRSELLRLSLEPDWRRDVAQMIDDWVDRISRATDPGVTPPSVQWLETNDPRPLAPGQCISTRSQVLWIRHAEEGLRFFGTVDVPGCPFDSRFPLSPHAWLRLQDQKELRPWPTETLMEDGDPWVGLKRFHRVILDAIAQSRVCDAAYRDSRLEASEQNDDLAVTAALRDLAQLPQPRPHDSLAPRGHDLHFEAARCVAIALGVEIVPPLLEQSDDPVRAIARASGLCIRRVTLEGRWWNADAGPLIGYLQNTRRPVALLRDGDRGYVMIDSVRATRTPVTPQVARNLSPSAVMFYRGLNSEELSGPDLLRLGASEVRSELRTIVLMGLAGATFGLLIPWITATVIDEAIPRADEPKLAVLCTFMMAIGLAIALFQIIQGLALVRIKGRLETVILPAIWDRLLNLPTRFFGQQESGDLALRAMGVARVIEVMSSTTVASLVVGLFALANLGVLFIIDWRLALLVVALIGIPSLATVLALPALWRKQRALAAAQGRISALLLVLLGGIARLRVAGAERRAFARWASHYRRQLDLMLGYQKLSDRLILLGDVWPLLAMMFVFAMVIHLNETSLTTGQFLAFVFAATQAMTAAIGIGKSMLPLLSGLEQFERFRPILAAVPEAAGAVGETLRLAGAIRLSNISFRYEDDGPVILDNVSLHARPGEFVAIVGPSGSGKSTLLRLLLGFESPSEGVIAYDNRELSTLDIREVRRQIGVVLQDAQLQPGDIYSNIVGFSSSLTHEDAWNAAELAGLADDIEAMPMGIHTVLGEGGAGLSSGQRQRLIIARALARRPRILFLDEATSALDNRSQALFSQSVHTRLQGTTRLAIAHRLSTIVDADRIYVINEGRIVQTGRYAQLIREPGLFRELARRQSLT